MVVEWDETKSRLNLRKHGLSFEAARLVFDDPLHISRQDRVEGNERRWQTLGMAFDVLLLVAHTWAATADEDERIRIISARRATRQERKVYEQGV